MFWFLSVEVEALIPPTFFRVIMRGIDLFVALRHILCRLLFVCAMALEARWPSHSISLEPCWTLTAGLQAHGWYANLLIPVVCVSDLLDFPLISCNLSSLGGSPHCIQIFQFSYETEHCNLLFRLYMFCGMTFTNIWAFYLTRIRNYRKVCWLYEVNYECWRR